MDKVDRLKESYQFLMNLGKVHKRKDVAEMMKTSESNVSKAFKGDERFLTNGFLQKFNKVFGGLFNDEWLLHGEGEMLAPQQPEREKIKITLAEMPKLAETPNKSGFSIMDGFSEKLRVLGYEAPKTEEGYRIIALDLADRLNRATSMSEEMVSMMSKPLLDRIGLVEKQKAKGDARIAELEAQVAALSMKEAK